MKRRFMVYAALLGTAVILLGCSFFNFDASDAVVTTDKTVSQDTLVKITSYLLDNVPDIRSEKLRLAAGNTKIKMTLSIIASPEPGHTKNDPDYKYHAEYYWVYVSYKTKDRLEKYDTYLVQKDLADIYHCDTEADTFVKVK
ncbi:MAG: hypothetical protein HQL26_06875 [Candidatus Omnitrophica bacterium]|nr:hypothetical protein [Candidatus Omnitrophota bacterium]